jgi:glycolate oxidase iron-sulfur subunit
VSSATRARVEAFAAKARDVHEFLAALGPIAPTGEIRRAVAYHDACHLAHAQKIREQPRQLLALVPGLTVLPLADAELCCGAAGTYNLVHPEMAERLAQRKTDAFAASGATALLTPNAGCHLHLGRKLRATGQPVPVLHPMELLDASYRRAALPE